MNRRRALPLGLGAAALYSPTTWAAVMDAPGNLFLSTAVLAYSTNLAALAARGAHYVDKVLRGANPGDLPIEQPTRFELSINVKVAKTIGVAVPQSLLIRADRVIE